MPGCLDCPVCGWATHQCDDDGLVLVEEGEFECPECEALLMLSVDADGVDVWVSEVEEP